MFGKPRRGGYFGRRRLQDGVAFAGSQRRPGFAFVLQFVVFGGHADGFAVVEGLLEGVAGGGEPGDPGRGLGWLGEGFRGRAEQFVAFGSGDRFRLGRLQRLDWLAGLAAAQFGVGGDGQPPGGFGDVLPFAVLGVLRL